MRKMYYEDAKENAAFEYLYPDLCNDTAVQPFIQERLDRGDLGYKTGVGVYDWRQRDMDDFRRRVTAPYLKNFNWKLPED